MKLKKIFAFLLAAPLFLSSCIMNNGICYVHTDANKDGICDVCGSKVKVEPGESESHDHDHGGEGGGSVSPCTTHTDLDFDGKCDVCGADLSVPTHSHVDGDKDGKCDICGANMGICTLHIDQNLDGFCDNCGATMQTVPAGSEVAIYLVLSSVGTIDGAPGTTYPELYLENAYRLNARVGDPLPGKDRIKHIYKSADFDSWVAYEGAGAPTVYTTVPGVNNKILYAQFTPNGSPSVPPTPTPGPDVDTTTTTFTLQTNFGSENWSTADPLIAAYAWDDSANSYTFAGTKVNDNSYTFDIYNSMKHVLFVRAPQGTTLNPLDWSAVWNQTDNLDIGSSVIAKITSWSSGNQGHSTAEWVY